MKRLTARQSLVLKTLKAWIKTNKWAPTIRELAAEIGVKGPTAFAHLNALERKGYIYRGKARQIEVLK